MHISKWKKKNPQKSRKQHTLEFSFWVEIYLQGDQWRKQTLSKDMQRMKLEGKPLPGYHRGCSLEVRKCAVCWCSLKHPVSLHKTACQHYPPPSLGSRIREKLMGSVLPFSSPSASCGDSCLGVWLVFGFGGFFFTLWHKKFPRAVWMLTWKAAEKGTVAQDAARETCKIETQNQNKCPFCGK